MNIIGIAAAGIITAIIAKVIQPTNRDLAAALSLTAVVTIGLTVAVELGNVYSGLQGTLAISGINSEYLQIAIKALIICYLCELSSSCCRDCGETAIGGIIDISGRIAIAIICLPLLNSFITVVKNILEL